MIIHYENDSRRIKKEKRKKKRKDDGKNYEDMCFVMFCGI